LLNRSFVNDITDASLMAALGRHMTRTVARQTVAASNLANLDTPGYKAREATFSDALDGQLSTVVKTAPNHLNGTAASGAGTAEVAGLAARRDGNNVQLDREMLAMSNAASDFNSAQVALSAKFRLVRYAINEGR
jgi:flagellar basal-body rod protein FlgB